jgi:hypothetical protein
LEGSDVVLALLMVNLAGGDWVEDLNVPDLHSDSGLASRWNWKSRNRFFITVPGAVEQEVIQPPSIEDFIQLVQSLPDLVLKCSNFVSVYIKVRDQFLLRSFTIGFGVLLDGFQSPQVFL